MTRLALSSLRHRSAAFAVSFLSVFLGATILMTFAAMLDTAAGPGVDDASAETLGTMAAVVGGWGMLIVVFAVTSTLTLSVRQRSKEMALLKAVGATPAQVGRMIVLEAALVAVVAGLAAIPGAALGGRLLLDVLHDTDQVAPSVGYAFGPIAVGMGLGVCLLAATVAAVVTARRAARMRATDAITAAETESGGTSRKRLVAGWLFLAGGLSCAALTVTVFDGKGIDAMATAGQGCILTSFALALFAPVLVRKVVATGASPLRLVGGSSGYLTVHNLRQRSQQMSAALVPIILFTGIATGTLYMQSIENSAPVMAGASTTAADVRAVETLNFVVVGMIAVFAAIMLINTLVASTSYRRREFGQQRLVGSTPRQVLGMVGLEGVALASAGVLLGSIASLFGVIPYSISRTDQVLPSSTVAIYLAVVSLAAVLTLASSVAAARWAIRTPAVDAVAA